MATIAQTSLFQISCSWPRVGDIVVRQLAAAMEPSTSQSRVSGANVRWLAIFIGLLLLGSTMTWLLSHGSSGATTRRIVILATRFTNGEQVVTFRLNPSHSEVTFADVVPVTEDGSVPTGTIRRGDYLFPVQAAGSPPSLGLRYLALPLPGARSKVAQWRIRQAAIQWPIRRRRLSTACEPGLRLSGLG